MNGNEEHHTGCWLSDHVDEDTADSRDDEGADHEGPSPVGEGDDDHVKTGEEESEE